MIPIPNPRRAIIPFRSGYTVACYNHHHSSWTCGDACARSPEAARDYANSETITYYRSRIAALRACLESVAFNEIYDAVDEMDATFETLTPQQARQLADRFLELD